MIAVRPHVVTSYHAATFASPNVTHVIRGSMGRSSRTTTVHAKGHVGDPIRRAATLARNAATPDLPVASVQLHVKRAAYIPNVLSLARSLVHRARRTARGHVPILEDAIYLAGFLATNCHARSAAGYL
jgi:hypothetical protein